jgi:transcriptional regulator with GAF, ATPase, and Fis domain
MSDEAHAPASSRREQLLAETLVGLADTLVDDYDVVDLLDRLVAACTALLGVDAGGLLLDDQRGRLSLVASTSEETRLLELFQIQNEQGPCLDCVQTGEVVLSADLEVDRERWPGFVPAALASGFRSVTAVPLRLRNQTIGCLNLFGSTVGLLAPEDRRLGQAMADVATIGILQQRSVHRNELLAEQLQHALTSRVAIEQAKGVLSERHQLDMNAAFNLLRRYARNNNRRLAELAMDVVRGDIEIEADEATGPAG